jgi:hypothetical protein
MLDGYQIFDADAHTMMSPNMWADLPEDLAARRPRAVRIFDESGLGYWNTGWYVVAVGTASVWPGVTANTPAMVLDELSQRRKPVQPSAPPVSIPLAALIFLIGCATQKRTDGSGRPDAFHHTSAHMTSILAWAGLCRSYNRYGAGNVRRRRRWPVCCRCVTKRKRSPLSMR